MSPSEAKQQVRCSRALEQMPVAREALSDGELSASAARVLVEAREENADEFAGSEDALVDAARALSVRELRAVVAHWRQAASPPRDAERGVTTLYMSPSFRASISTVTGRESISSSSM